MKLEIIFDGGAAPNPGQGYGSFQILSCGKVLHTERRNYGHPYTNNQAEWRTLAESLAFALKTYGPCSVLVRGDSNIVINGASRRWRVKDAKLKPLAEEVWKLDAQHHAVFYVWHPREKSVAALGH